MAWFHDGRLVGFMIGESDELPLLSNNDGKTVNFIGACGR